MRPLLVGASGLLVTAACCSMTACTTHPGAGDVQERLAAVVDEYVSAHPGVLGAIVRIDVGTQQTFRQVSGFFDISRSRPVRITDQFLAGSITKVFTATLVLQLIEDGLVRSDGPLVDYLPAEWATLVGQTEHGAEITVAQALSHRTGLAHVLSDDAFRTYVLPDPSHPWTPFEVAAQLFPDHREARFTPGERFDYNNTNYLLLGTLIEHVAQKRYGAVLEENILSRISLDEVCLPQGLMGSCSEDVVHGYARMDGRLYDGQQFHSASVMAEGAIVSSADALVTLLQALSAGSLFARDGTFEHMVRRPAGSDRYGMGMEVWDDPQIGLYYGHRGYFSGTASMMLRLPGPGITVATAQTFDGSAERPATDALAKAVLSGVAGITLADPSARGELEVLSYSELGLHIREISEFDRYGLKADTVTAKAGHKLILVALEGQAPRSGAVPYVPSAMRVAYAIDGDTASARCLAVGHIIPTRSGTIEEDWLTSAEEGMRTLQLSATEGRKVVLFAVFEVPVGSPRHELSIR